MTAKPSSIIDPAARRNIQAWLEGEYDDETKDCILNQLDSSPEQLTDAFYTTLSFGTGGLRGLMGIGPNRMNKYTIGAATQGLANYILQQPVPQGLKHHRVAVGYDSRNNSEEFAKEASKVLAGNGIEARIFSTLHPTPLVSFAVRRRNCTAGIMITASHNPPAYNGYKVYWNDGAQVLPPHDEGIISEVNNVTDPSHVKHVSDVNNPLIIFEGDELDNDYLNTIAKLQLYPEEDHKDGSRLKIIYTPLHGTGVRLVPDALKRWGFTDVHLVDEQAITDGDFPTVRLPNPEDPAAMKLGIEYLTKQQADILLATDPDADRVGVAVAHQGSVQLLNGNQIACLCVYHVLNAIKERNQIPSNGACIKTLPTTELFKAICKAFNVSCFDVLTGFKYIAEKIREWDADKTHTYLFGGEESYGYLFGTHSRDKDGVIMCALIAELALHAKLHGKTLVDLINDIYKRFGYYIEGLLSINYPESKEGKERMASAMADLRSNPPGSFKGRKIIAVEDYLSGKKTDLLTGKSTSLGFPVSDVLIFRLENDGKLIVRPSGTEPKIKIYAALKDCSKDDVDMLMAEAKSLL